ncbi:MAG: carbon storage regulator CsrA [Chloroflexi bacterium]|nr:carbon storage regulator CsrA [Chloroflexota bacterium]
MLILTRRGGEAINIGGDVEITVLEVSGDYVRLGIQAPRNVPVLRKELRDEVEQQNRLAASLQGRLPRQLAGSLKRNPMEKSLRP